MPGDFEESPSSPETVGSSPRTVAVGDFNSDGNGDLAVVNANDHNVTILLGNGSGDFTEPANSPEPGGSGYPVALAVGDFNGDGSDDLALANQNNNDVTILLGNGAGDFTLAASNPHPVGTYPKALAVGDFNGDGNDDVVTANFYGDSLTILLGDGEGGFTQPVSSPEPAGKYPAGGLPIMVAVGDFNGDGNDDLVTAHPYSDAVLILIGDGTGDFAAPATGLEAAGTWPMWVAPGDFNGDGNADLAVANRFSGNVTILIGDGTGDFNGSASSPEPAGRQPLSLAVGDFNGDGMDDLAVGNEGSNDVTVLLGLGTGDFIPALTGPEQAGGLPQSVAVGDFNGDGQDDIAVANRGSNDVTILVNQTPPPPPPPQGTVSGTKYEDENADGQRQEGERALQGWEIRAYVDENDDDQLNAGEESQAATDTTDEEGVYSLSLDPGEYVVCEVARAGWIQSAPANSICDVGPRQLASGGHALSVSPGSSESGYDFGHYRVTQAPDAQPGSSPDPGSGRGGGGSRGRDRHGDIPSTGLGLTAPLLAAAVSIGWGFRLRRMARRP